MSPANKDRPDNRRAFVSKCHALLQKHVCLSLVDLVTTRQFNLYCELLEVLGQSAPASLPAPPATYAVTCRARKEGERSLLENWAYPLVVGHALPTLPIWLTDDRFLSLDLESSYEATCRHYDSFRAHLPHSTTPSE